MNKKTDWIKVLSELEYKAPILTGVISIIPLFFMLLGFLLNDFFFILIGIVEYSLLILGICAFYEYKLRGKK